MGTSAANGPRGRPVPGTDTRVVTRLVTRGGPPARGKLPAPGGGKTGGSTIAGDENSGLTRPVTWTS